MQKKEKNTNNKTGKAKNEGNVATLTSEYCNSYLICFYITPNEHGHE
jgi:hypothetical protein